MRSITDRRRRQTIVRVCVRVHNDWRYIAHAHLLFASLGLTHTHTHTHRARIRAHARIITQPRCRFKSKCASTIITLPLTLSLSRCASATAGFPKQRLDVCVCWGYCSNFRQPWARQRVCNNVSEELYCGRRPRVDEGAGDVCVGRTFVFIRH